MSCPGCKSNYRSQAESTSENLKLKNGLQHFHAHGKTANTQMRVNFYNYVSFIDRQIYTSTHSLGMCTSFQTRGHRDLREPLPTMTGFALLQFPEI